MFLNLVVTKYVMRFLKLHNVPTTLQADREYRTDDFSRRRA